MKPVWILNETSNMDGNLTSKNTVYQTYTQAHEVFIEKVKKDKRDIKGMNYTARLKPDSYYSYQHGYAAITTLEITVTKHEVVTRTEVT